MDEEQVSEAEEEPDMGIDREDELDQEPEEHEKAQGILTGEPTRFTEKGMTALNISMPEDAEHGGDDATSLSGKPIPASSAATDDHASLQQIKKVVHSSIAELEEESKAEEEDGETLGDDDGGDDDDDDAGPLERKKTTKNRKGSGQGETSSSAVHHIRQTDDSEAPEKVEAKKAGLENAGT